MGALVAVVVVAALSLAGNIYAYIHWRRSFQRKLQARGPSRDRLLQFGDDPLDAELD
jgi:hypothetical protein